MDALKSTFKDARKLRKQIAMLAKGVMDGTAAQAAVTKEQVDAILKEDIENSRKLIERLGGKAA
jgi:hypothetical protein